MIPAALVLLAAGAWTTAADFVESRVDPHGEILQYECPDIDQDGDGDLLVVHAAADGRALSLFRCGPDGSFPAEPDWKMSLPEDVVAYTVFDVRPDPGLEILLFTARGMFSVSPATRGLRGNIRKEVELDLFPDVADPEDVAPFRLFADVDGDGTKDLLLPSAESLVVHAVVRGPDSWRIVRRGAVPCRVKALESTGRRGFDTLGGSTSIEIDSSLSDLFPGASSSIPRFEEFRYLARGASWRVPALVDWNGDGRLDAVHRAPGAFEVYLQAEDGSFPTDHPLHVAPKVALGLDDDVRFLDLDGDGRREIVILRDEGEGLSRDFIAVVLARDADGGVSEAPAARIKLEATNVDWSFADVDRDGRTDLIARMTELPSGIADLASVRIISTLLVFRGQEHAGFSRHPDARFVRTFRPEQLERVRESQVLDLSGDYDGDGLCDLLFVQPDGLLEIRPLRRDGDGFVFGDEPLSTYRPARPIRDARPMDVTYDGVSDLVLRHEASLTLFVSRPKAGRPAGGGR